VEVGLRITSGQRPAAPFLTRRVTVSVDGNAMFMKRETRAVVTFALGLAPVLLLALPGAAGGSTPPGTGTVIGTFRMVGSLRTNILGDGSRSPGERQFLGSLRYAP
jgi:hypothetical protein